MAKKSAKSKGFRKSVEKKPYLSKKDIIILCVVLVAVAIGAILLFTYDDGALKVKDGKIVRPFDRTTIAGNFLTLLADVETVGADVFVSPSSGGITALPSILIRELVAAGE